MPGTINGTGLKAGEGLVNYLALLRLRYTLLSFGNTAVPLSLLLYLTGLNWLNKQFFCHLLLLCIFECLSGWLPILFCILNYE